MSSSESSVKTSGHVKHIIIASVILFVMAAAQKTVIEVFGFEMIKATVPLKSEIAAFPDMVSERFVLARNINDQVHKNGKAVFTADVEKTLGTEDYISWIFLDRDTSRQRGSFVGVRFHLAYYTAMTDAVPHVPDNCMVAGGLQPDLENTGKSIWDVPVRDPQWNNWSSFELRRASFVDAKKPDAGPLVAFYVFSINGEPMWDRKSIRLALANPFKKYAYYMKIELMALSNDGLSVEQAEKICHDFFVDASDEIFALIASKEDIEKMEQGK